MLNPEAFDSEDPEFLANYKYNLIIEIQLSTINGLSAVRSSSGAGNEACALIAEDRSILERSKYPLATFFIHLK